MPQPEDYDLLQEIASQDVRVLEEKGKSYGGSWKKRGGPGAFMMLARKWDRLENVLEKKHYDLFAVAEEDTREEGILDDIGDLRRYLLLVEGEIRRRKNDQICAERILTEISESKPPKRNYKDYVVVMPGATATPQIIAGLLGCSAAELCQQLRQDGATVYCKIGTALPLFNEPVHSIKNAAFLNPPQLASGPRGFDPKQDIE